jgi:hypothetical protein
VPDEGLELLDIVTTTLILLVNCFAVATLATLLAYRRRPRAGWVTTLVHCRRGLILLGVSCIAGVAAMYGASRADSAYAHFIYPALLAFSPVIVSSALAVLLKPRPA